MGNIVHSIIKSTTKSRRFPKRSYKENKVSLFKKKNCSVFQQFLELFGFCFRSDVRRICNEYE